MLRTSYTSYKILRKAAKNGTFGFNTNDKEKSLEKEEKINKYLLSILSGI